jgi:hypothetical protein
LLQTATRKPFDESRDVPVACVWVRPHIGMTPPVESFDRDVNVAERARRRQRVS